MQRFSLFLLAFFGLWLGHLPAQDSLKQLLTPRQCIDGSVYPDRLSQLQWQGNAEAFTYLHPTHGNLIRETVKGEKTELLTLEDLAQKLPGEPKRFPPISWEDEAHFTLRHQNQLYRYDLKTASMTALARLDGEGEHLEFSSQYHQAYVKGDNLFVREVGESNSRQLTTDGSLDIAYGQAAHRSEFGITKGLFWSPAGEKLAFYRIDQTAVTAYPRTDYEAFPAQPAPFKYPMAGQASEAVTVGVYDLSSQSLIYLQTGEPSDQYLTNLSWSPDGKEIYVAVVNRDQNHLWLRAYDAQTGSLLRTLFEETHPKYVEPEHGPVFLPTQPNQFVWLSERDGWNHLYLYSTNGTLISRLTRGDWEVLEFMGFNGKGKYAFFSATKESPLEEHLYRLDLDSDKVIRLTLDPGTHRGVVHPEGRYVLDEFSSLEVPGRVELFDAKQGKVRQRVYEAPNPLEDFAIGDISLFSLYAEDSTELFCRIIRPDGFDPAQKYPVIVYVYGGPHVQLVTNSWLGGARPFLPYLAQQGYVVFTLDNRGTARRGLAFEQATFRQLGTQELADQLVGVDFLQSQAYVDTNRMGVYGWSFGGFMATSLMLRHPGTFQVGVAGGPVIDWRLYEVMYTERYMDTPEQNPEGYQQAELLPYVENLTGRLLIIHGLQDPVVVPQHSARLLRESVRREIQLDYYPYTNHEHNVRGLEREHLNRKIEQYFADHLLGE